MNSFADRNYDQGIKGLKSTAEFRLSNTVGENGEKILRIAIYINRYLSFMACYNVEDVTFNRDSDQEFTERMYNQKKSIY